jgi:hypothetical protein
MQEIRFDEDRLEPRDLSREVEVGQSVTVELIDPEGKTQRAAKYLDDIDRHVTEVGKSDEADPVADTQVASDVVDRRQRPHKATSPTRSVAPSVSVSGWCFQVQLVTALSSQGIEVATGTAAYSPRRNADR